MRGECDFGASCQVAQRILLFSRPVAMMFVKGKADESRQLLNITQGLIIWKKRIQIQTGVCWHWLC